MAARRMGAPPHERSRSPSARRREVPEPVAEPVEDSSVGMATHAPTNTPRPIKKRSRSKSSAREKSASCSREALEAADDDDGEEGEDDDEEKGPMTLTLGFGSSISIQELDEGMCLMKRRLDAIAPDRDKLKKQFKEVDCEVSDIKTKYKAFAKLRKSRLKRRYASPGRSRSKSKSRLGISLQSSKRARGGDDYSEGEENEGVLLDPVDPAVAASRERQGPGVLELGASPAVLGSVPRVDHNRNA